MEVTITIQQCKYILEIAYKGSFSRAARSLFIAQSSLSSSVKQLEGELGIMIFERSKNGVFLTAEGVEFVRYAEQIVTQNDLILERYSSPRERKKLYISTQHYDFVADVFCRLLRKVDEDGYDFSLKEIQTYEVIREVETAICDIGILAIKASDADIMTRCLTSKGLTFTQFLTVSPHVFVRASHPLASRRSLSYSDLKPYPYVSYEQGSHNSSFFTEELTDGLVADKHITISDRATLMNVLVTTDCYTVGTGVMPSALNGGKIVSIPLESEAFYRIGYILRHDRKRSELCENFIALLHEFAGAREVK